jgi:hypothetical protein
MGFKGTKADPDMYICVQVKPDGFEYYEMLLIYVDDILCVSHNPKPVMDEIIYSEERKCWCSRALSWCKY